MAKTSEAPARCNDLKSISVFFRISAIDCLVDRHDVIVYDAESHACILDGVRLHMGKRYVFKHNDIEDCEKQLERATKLAEETGGAILVITEGVFGMRGDQGLVKEIVDLKKKYNFRLFVDDAHGIGTLGSVLDLGCGTGLTGLEIKDFCSKLEGVDLSKKMLELALHFQA